MPDQRRDREPAGHRHDDEGPDRYGPGLVQGGSGMRIEREIERPTEPTDEHAAIAERIADGQDVCDRDGEKVGSVGRVYRPRPGIQGEVFVAVETGFLGFGKTFYVPISHVRGFDDDCVLLDVERDQLDQTGWDEQPPAIQLDSYQPE